MIGRKCAFACLALLLALGAAEAAEFTADLVISEGDSLKEGRILVKGARFRMELPDPRGPDTVVQIDPHNSRCRLLVPRYSAYMEFDLKDRMVSMFNPFLVLDELREYYEVKDEGEEECAGHPCRKEAFMRGETVVVRYWTATDLAFPVKILMLAQEGYFTELRNVKMEAVDGAAFDIPEGYEKTDRAALRQRVEEDPEMQAKEKVYQDNRIRKTSLSPRFKVGDEFRALIGKDVAIEVSARQSGTEEIVWTVTPVKDGVEGEPTRTTGEGKVEFAADSGVTGLILRCERGEGWGSIDLKGKRPLILATKTISTYTSGSGAGRTIPADCTFFSLRIKAIEEPDGGTLAVRASLCFYKGEGESRVKDDQTCRLEPGEEKYFEKKGSEEIDDYDVTLVAPGGRATVTLVIDRRPEGERKPF